MTYQFESSFIIGDRPVGGAAPCLLVAEIGPNHNGNVETAFGLVQAAAAAKCDAVKFQYRMAEAEMFDRTSRSYYYDEPRYNFVERVQQFPHETHRALRMEAKKLGLAYICSVMSEDAVERVADLSADAIKIPSGEAGNPWLIDRASRAKMPIIASSGMSPQDEIDAMMDALHSQSRRVALLHCLSEYPTRLNDMNLRMIPTLAARYNCPTGLSDHSRRLNEIAASVALGAAIVEVHFTFDRAAKGPDHRISLLPSEMRRLVRRVRDLETALGRPEKILGAHAESMRRTFTNSIVARRDIRAGERLDRASLALKKPGTGLGPDKLPSVLGRRVRHDIAANALIRLEDLE